ncbi:hypothetical protein QR680_015283 [Steinernema hermaphroditum]|uniref:Uncharacterized protein n=1 Tax=Steinernema hermaphroditum TaxID=289476 RepID=A0AA39LJY9_9BILA|nr:hypothetical protein QR680_015283 [Steinernema hermaphroditum]
MSLKLLLCLAAASLLLISFGHGAPTEIAVDDWNTPCGTKFPEGCFEYCLTHWNCIRSQCVDGNYVCSFVFLSDAFKWLNAATSNAMTRCIVNAENVKVDLKI